MKNAFQKTLFKSSNTIVSIRADGSILVDGFNRAIEEMPNLSSSNLCNLSLEAGGKSPFIPCDASAGIRTFFIIAENGHVKQFGQNSDTENYGAIHTESWNDIVEIVAKFHALGLKKDGTAVASGYNDHGQCNVSNWRNVDHIDCSLFFSAGIKKDGTVVFSGRHEGWIGNVASWKNIKSIFCESDYLLGIDSEGNVHYFGEKKDYIDTITGWKKVVKIVGEWDNIAALTTDGTVLTIGDKAVKDNVRSWKDMIDIVWADRVVALDKNGHVFVGLDQAEPYHDYSDFNDRIWSNWKNIIKIISFNMGFLALAKDGSIKSCLRNMFSEELPKAKRWHCFSSFEKMDDEYENGFKFFKSKIELATELSSLHGLFTGKRRRKLKELIAEADRELRKYSNN